MDLILKTIAMFTVNLRTGRAPIGAMLPRCHGVAWICIAGLAISGLSSDMLAQVQVRTLGGGRTSPNGPDAGYVDGNTLQDSQFNFPAGAAVDLSGNILVADRNNGSVRKLDVAANRASTLIAGLNQPVGVAVDRTNNLYVLTAGDGLIRKMDRFGVVTTNLVKALGPLGQVSLVRAQFVAPTALAVAGSGDLYITEAGGSLFRIDSFSQAKSLVRSGLSRPAGVAVLDSGLVAVSEAGNHRVLFINQNGLTVERIGTGDPGFRDGPMATAQFSQPHQLARAPDGSVVVADRMNHRVRLIRPDGIVSTLYGVDPKSWEGPECLTCNPIILPGWFDSTAEFAEAREPVGVAVAGNGTIYTTESYYHLVREVTGASVAVPGGAGGSSTNLIVLPAVITPNSGYFPLGQKITVINRNTNAFFRNRIFYTTDGTTPTTNSHPLPFLYSLENSGTILWREPLRDLRSLRLVAFVGDRASEVTAGSPSRINEIGVTRAIAAGIGSTVVIPISVNLRTNTALKSLQFRVEVTPKNAAMPMIPSAFRALPIRTNDFIPVVTSSASGGTSSFAVSPYTNGLARGLAISFIGTDSHLSIEDFAVVAMLAVPIPATAKLGDRYSISVLSPSGTSDGAEAAVPLQPMPARDILVTHVTYLAGDSTPAYWYNSDGVTDSLCPADTQAEASFGSPDEDFYSLPGFGDRGLNNNDVNNTFSAALGVRVPYPFTDLFDAMDAYPEDSATTVGGDGLIRFLDWQVILQRSLGLAVPGFERTWSTNGVRAIHESCSNRSFLSPNLPASTLTRSSPGSVWVRHAVIHAAPIENVLPGVPTEMPVYVTVGAGNKVAGLVFRASLHSEGGAPDVQQPLEFVPAAGMPKPVQRAGVSPNDLLCGWSMVPANSFDPPLQGRARLGHIRIILPATARAGQTYTLRFPNADGSPDLRTQYDFETRPASIWVQSAALQKPEFISDEWKTHFFGSITSGSARPDVDPDNDGVSNRDEYFGGTNPLDPSSAPRLEALELGDAKGRVVIRWLAVPGRMYTIEASSSLLQPNWTPVVRDLAGTGLMQEFIQTDLRTSAGFYRLRIRTEDQED